MPPTLAPAPRLDESRPFRSVRIAVLTVSDTRSEADDTSGDTLAARLTAAGHILADRAILKDDAERIAARLRGWIADPTIDAVITTGGTGFSGRDVTPEALEPLFQKRMEGFSVLFHQYSATTVGTSSLQSRATGGLIGTTFVFVLPGSRGACRDAWEGILRAQFDNRHLPCNFVELMPRLAER